MGLAHLYHLIHGAGMVHGLLGEKPVLQPLQILFAGMAM
jgi:hypothetical protein